VKQKELILLMICSELLCPTETTLRIFSPDYKGNSIYFVQDKYSLFHFFRLCEKIHHPQNSHSISSKSSLLEPMAKDLLENDFNSDVEMDLESYMTAADETLRPESSLPSIEELTKNVQNLIDKDNDATADVTLDEVNKSLTLEKVEIKEKKVNDTTSESFAEKVQEVEKCLVEHEKSREIDEGKENGNKDVESKGQDDCVNTNEIQNDDHENRNDEKNM